MTDEHSATDETVEGGEDEATEAVDDATEETSRLLADDDEIPAELPPLDESEAEEVEEDAAFGEDVGNQLVDAIGEAFANRPEVN